MLTGVHNNPTPLPTSAMLPTQDVGIPCPYMAHYRDPTTGQHMSVLRACKKWRECPNCFQRRMDEMRGNLERALLGQPERKLYLVRAAEGTIETAQIKEHFSTKERVSFPHETQDYHFMMSDPRQKPGCENMVVEEVDYSALEDLDYRTVCTGVKGRNMAGKLGRKVAAPKDEALIMHKLPAYSTNADQMKLEEVACVVEDEFQNSKIDVQEDALEIAGKMTGREMELLQHAGYMVIPQVHIVYLEKNFPLSTWNKGKFPQGNRVGSGVNKVRNGNPGVSTP